MVKDSIFNNETRRKDMDRDNVHVIVTENKERSKNIDSKRHRRFKSQLKGK